MLIHEQGRTTATVLPLVFGELTSDVQEVSYAVDGYTLQGFITLPPAGFKHKLKQYLYINSRYVQAGQVGKMINKLHQSVLLRLQQSISMQHPRQAPKDSQLHPAFALQLSCPNDCFSISTEIDKSHVEFADWPAILNLFQAATIKAWHTVVPSKLLAEALQGTHAPKPDAKASHAGNNSPSTKSHLLVQPAAGGTQQLHHSATPFSHSHRRAVIPHESIQDQAEAELGSLFQTGPHRFASDRSAKVSGPYAAASREQPTAANAASGDDVLLAVTAAKPGIRCSFQPKLHSSTKVRLSIPKLSGQQACPVPPLQGGAIAATAKASSTYQEQPQQLAEAKQQIIHDIEAQADCQAQNSQPKQAAPLASSGKATGCELLRTYSGPPFYSPRHRSAHTNPVYSLQTIMPIHAPPLGQSRGAGTPAGSAGQPGPSTSDQAYVSQRPTLTVSGYWGGLKHKARLQQSRLAGRNSTAGTKLASATPAQLPLADITNTGADPSAKHRAYQTADKGMKGSCSDSRMPSAVSKGIAAIADRPPLRKQVQFSTDVIDTNTDVAMQQQRSRPSQQQQQQQPQLTPFAESQTVAEADSHAPKLYGHKVEKQRAHHKFDPQQSTKQQSTGFSADPSLPAQPSPSYTSLNVNSTAPERLSPKPTTATELLSTWTNPCLQSTASSNIADLPSLSGAAARCIMPEAISRSDLQQGVAMRQFEHKFIALVCNGVLCIADQHAADERVQLEKLRTAVLSFQVQALSYTQCCLSKGACNVPVLD